MLYAMLYCVFRSVRNGICVVDLSDKDRLAPNPVRTFEQAFHEFRKYFINAVCLSLLLKVGCVVLCYDIHVIEPCASVL